MGSIQSQRYVNDGQGEGNVRMKWRGVLRQGLALGSHTANWDVFQAPVLTSERKVHWQLPFDFLKNHVSSTGEMAPWGKMLAPSPEATWVPSPGPNCWKKRSNSYKLLWLPQLTTPPLTGYYSTSKGFTVEHSSKLWKKLGSRSGHSLL